MPIRSKSPVEELDWSEDWSEWLGEDTITASAWEIFPPGTLAIVSSNYTTTTTQVVLEGGTQDIIYRVVNRIGTESGKVGERSLYILVEMK